MERSRFYLSTIGEDAPETAREYGFGLEIAEYCTAWNMDREFVQTDAQVRRRVAGIPARVLHGPFTELFPCAIDPKVRQVTEERFLQAISLAQNYGADKVIFHAGFNPHIYYPVWFTEQSGEFWKSFVPKIPDNMTVCLENVLETEPEMLLRVIRAVDSPRLKLCLDIGHVHAYSPVSVEDWVNACGDAIRHCHIHNNDGTRDAHNALFNGTIDMAAFFAQAEEKAPRATYTMELLTCRESAQYLEEAGII